LSYLGIHKAWVALAFYKTAAPCLPAGRYH